jgi:hypothetical protein
MRLKIALWIAPQCGLDFGVNLRFRPQLSMRSTSIVDQPRIFGTISGERPQDFDNFARHNQPPFLRPVVAGFPASSSPLPDPAIGNSISDTLCSSS